MYGAPSDNQQRFHPQAVRDKGRKATYTAAEGESDIHLDASKKDGMQMEQPARKVNGWEASGINLAIGRTCIIALPVAPVFLSSVRACDCDNVHADFAQRRVVRVESCCCEVDTYIFVKT